MLVRAFAWIVDELHELGSTANIRNLPHYPIASGLAYLISGLLMRGAIDTLSDVILAPEKVLDDRKPASHSSRIYCAGWAVQALLRETREHCTLDCLKIATGDLPKAEDYFVRFCRPDIQRSTGGVTRFGSDRPCTIGIVDDGVMCPFGEHRNDDDGDLDEKEIRRLLRFVAQVLEVRTQACEPRGDSDPESPA